MIFKKNISSLHLPHNKHTAGCEPEQIAAPKEVFLTLELVYALLTRLDEAKVAKYTQASQSDNSD